MGEPGESSDGFVISNLAVVGGQGQWAGVAHERHQLDQFSDGKGLSSSSGKSGGRDREDPFKPLLVPAIQSHLERGYYVTGSSQ